MLNFSLLFFLYCSYFLGNSQPDVSYKGCSYKKKRVVDSYKFINHQISSLGCNYFLTLLFGAF